MGRYCIHEWAKPLAGPLDVTWRCSRCGELRVASGDKPVPGTFMAASEDFTNAVRNLGLEIVAALPGPLRRLLTRQ